MEEERGFQVGVEGGEGEEGVWVQEDWRGGYFIDTPGPSCVRSELVRRRRSHAILAVSRRKKVVYHRPFMNAEELSPRCWRTYRRDALESCHW